jgi:hypothetical protein
MKPAAPRELLRFVAPDEFKELRQDAALTHQQVTNALGCSVQPVRNWETGKTRIPWPAFEVMRIRNCHHLAGHTCKGWQIRGEVFFDPRGTQYEPGEIASPFYLRPLVKTLQRELDERRKRDAPPPPEQLQLPFRHVKRWC